MTDVPLDVSMDEEKLRTFEAVATGWLPPLAPTQEFLAALCAWILGNRETLTAGDEMFMRIHFDLDAKGNAALRLWEIGQRNAKCACGCQTCHR